MACIRHATLACVLVLHVVYDDQFNTQSFPLRTDKTVKIPLSPQIDFSGPHWGTDL